MKTQKINRNFRFFLRTQLTRGDKILILFLIILSVASMAVLRLNLKAGSSIEIKIKNKFYGKFSLKNDTTFTVQGAIGKTTIEIKSARVRVAHSDCPEKICVKTGWVHRSGSLIVCVPNQVVISVTGGKKENYLDVITQ